MAKIFLTGATGYVGGDALYALYRTHPEYKIAALVRDQQKATHIAKEYPNVRIIPGSLEDGDLIADEASKADIILNLAATSHLPSVKSIHKGLKARSSNTPAHWIQISGATVLACAQIADKTFGEPSDKVYRDLNSAEVWSLVKQYPSRTIDNFIREVATQDSDINTALVVGPIIYGSGRGPGNQRSIQIPELARTAITRKKAWQVGRGLSAWDHVHVRDLSNITLRLVERAVGDSGQSASSNGLWNEDGVYFTGAGHLSFAEISRRIAKTASKLGLTESQDVDSLTAEEADKLVDHASILLGTNARCEAKRAVEKLGWRPAEESLEQGIEETVRDEASKLGGL